jgi:hypothetical protein
VTVKQAMGVRLLDEVPPNNVIPLPRKRSGGFTATEVTPEPAQLYHLIVLTFLLHVPSARSEKCACCDRNWPCEQVRLAFRLREGF